MGNIKRQHTPEFKISVVMDILKGEQTLSQICSKYSIHPTQARRWKEKLLEGVKQSFTGETGAQQLRQKDKLIDDLYQEIGKLKYQLDWVKKKMGYIDN